jgi:C-terminal processing protease CtpA/Prc
MAAADGSLRATRRTIATDEAMHRKTAALLPAATTLRRPLARLVPCAALLAACASLAAACGTPAAEPARTPPAGQADPARSDGRAHDHDHAPAPTPAPAAVPEAAPAPALPAASPLTLDAMLADLDELDRIVRQHWSYLDHRVEHFDLDLPAALAAARAALDGEPDRQALFDALQRFVATLQDGHAGLRLPGAELPARAWPFTLVPGAEGLLVEVVAPATFAIMDVEPGDQLIAVDAVSAHALLSEAMRRTPASTLGSRRAWGAGRMRQTDRERSRFLMQKPGGRIYELEFDNLPRDTVLPPAKRFAGGTSWRRLDERTGYLRIGSFAAPDAAAWKAAPPEARDEVLAPAYADIRQAFAELAGLDALVLDLRRNTGGTDLLGQELARHLLPPGSVYYRLQGRLDDGTWGTMHENRLADTPPEHPFGGRLAVLIDEWTFSTADNLCACLQDLHPDVTFVGRPTAGGTGAPRPFELPATGAVVTFCTMRVERPSGVLIEGRGTTPDVPVTPTAADLAAGADPDLQAALALLAGAPASDP